MKNSVLVPLKLKFRDSIWLMLLVLLATAIVLLLTNSISLAQPAKASTSPKFNGSLPEASLLKISDVPVSFDRYYLDSTFSIHVPDYLVKVTDLDERASLQFKNIFNDTYFMVVVEKKSTEGHNTLEQVQEHFKMNLLLNGGVLSNSKTLNISQLHSIRNEVEWLVNGSPMAYSITFIDTPESLYKIYGWTLASQKRYLKDFVEAADSFQIINHNLR